MSEVSSEAVEAWEAYRDGELWHRNRRQLRKRDYLAGYLAAHQPARVLPSAEEVAEVVVQTLVTVDYVAEPDEPVDPRVAHWNATVGGAVLALFASQPTVAEVREQVAREIEAAMDQDAVRNGTHIVFDDVNRSGKRNAVLAIAARIARTETKGGE